MPGLHSNLAVKNLSLYIALCGSHPPVDITVKCDQESFSKYKQMLRYYDTDEKSRQEGIKFFEDIITGLLDEIEPLRIEGQTEDMLCATGYNS